MPVPPADQRSSYRLWGYDKLRYGDLDRQGHVNNAVYATLAETGRVTFFNDPGLALMKPGQDFVVARLEIDFRSELFYPGSVDIGFRVLELGRSSCRIGEAIFCGDACAATVEVVEVLADDATRRSTPIEGKLRQWLEAAMVANGGRRPARAADRAAMPPADQRAAYALWAHDKLRYGDTDRQQHINNAAYLTFLETGRVTFFYDQELGLLPPGREIVVARLEIDYHAELRYPGIADIGLRVLQLGRSSFRLGEAIFDGGRCAATAEVVMVLVDGASRKAVPIDGRMREWLERHRCGPI